MTHKLTVTQFLQNRAIYAADFVAVRDQSNGSYFIFKVNTEKYNVRPTQIISGYVFSTIIKKCKLPIILSSEYIDIDETRKDLELILPGGKK